MGSTYDAEMVRGANEYADILTALASADYIAGFTQTGGMCFAIQLHLNDGTYALVTDKDDVLAPTRSDHRGWSIGIYDPKDTSDPLRSESTDDSTAAGLLALAASMIDRSLVK
jgi:hypothetical protein